MPSRERRYRIADPYLRSWLRFLEPHMAEIEHRAQLTDDPIPMVAVSRSGIDAPAVDARYHPEDLIRAW